MTCVQIKFLRPLYCSQAVLQYLFTLCIKQCYNPQTLFRNNQGKIAVASRAFSSTLTVFLASRSNFPLLKGTLFCIVFWLHIPILWVMTGIKGESKAWVPVCQNPPSPRPWISKQFKRPHQEYGAHREAQERKMVFWGSGHSTLPLCKTKENHSIHIKQ